jgi:predicted alpha/beta-fold hydrolase
VTVQDIEDFIAKLQLKLSLATRFTTYFEKYGEKNEWLLCYQATKEITIPVLVIHDKDDPEVLQKQQHIYEII